MYNTVIYRCQGPSLQVFVRIQSRSHNVLRRKARLGTLDVLVGSSADRSKVKERYINHTRGLWRLTPQAFDALEEVSMSWTIGTLSVQHSALVGAAILDVAIQLAGWAVSATFKTEKLYDLLGSSTFAAVAIGTLTYASYYHPRQIVVTVFVLSWALRLGSLLFYRVLKTGSDSRFEEVKNKPFTYLIYWLMQALWVWITMSPVIVLNGAAENPGLWASDIIGGVLWGIGFFCEATADWQKLRFKLDPANKGRYIKTGLWKYSRYPNYFGEMCTWWGIWLMCIPVFGASAYWLTVASPLFVMSLLLFVSGIPLQEKQAQQRWGNEAGYQAYRRSTFLLLPLPKLWAGKGQQLDEKLTGQEPPSGQV
eukprot:jgi/Botrbrau1/21354/Bobra.0184s0063.1